MFIKVGSQIINMDKVESVYATLADSGCSALKFFKDLDNASIIDTISFEGSERAYRVLSEICSAIIRGDNLYIVEDYE